MTKEQNVDLPRINCPTCHTNNFRLENTGAWSCSRCSAWGNVHNTDLSREGEALLLDCKEGDEFAEEDNPDKHVHKTLTGPTGLAVYFKNGEHIHATHRGPTLRETVVSNSHKHKYADDKGNEFTGLVHAPEK